MEKQPIKYVSRTVFVPIEHDGQPDLRNIDCKVSWARQSCPGQPIIKAKLMIPAKELNKVRRKLRKER